MPRAKGKTDYVMGIQEDLDNVMGALVGWQLAERIIRLQIEQARQRTGLNELLLPALDELDIMSTRVKAAKSYVSSTLSRLVE